MSQTPAEPLGVILVVDDVEAKRYLVSTWLRRAGYEVIEAGTGAEALSKSQSAELVVLDVHLPDMTGFEVCQRLKADPDTSAIPVIHVSATAVAVGDRAHGLIQGADAYLVEPVDPDELLAVVTAVLRYYRARARAEHTASLLNLLVNATFAINSAETFDGLARAAAVSAARIFGAPALLVCELPDGQPGRISATPGGAGPVRRGGSPGLVERVVSLVLPAGAGSTVATLSPQDWLGVVPDSTLRGEVCVAAVRAKPGRPPVALVIASAGISSAEDEQILLQLTQSIALGVEALRSYAEEHLIALTLQRSFLPASLPEIAGLRMSFRYVPASDQAEVGGDFYEALALRDGRVLIAIGDVQGHSLRAATIMGELRHSLRAFSTEGHSPVEITRLVNDVLREYHPGIIATLCLVLLDPATGELEIVNCGHMPLLVVDSNGASYLGQGGLLLGLPMHAPHSEKAKVSSGDTVLLITDGLVEDRRVPLDTNLRKLLDSAFQARHADIEAFSNHLMATFGSREDDVAMIAFRLD